MVTNVCHACHTGFYSYGAKSYQCTDDRTSFSGSMWGPAPEEGQIIPVTISQSANPSHEAQLAIDGDCSTFSEVSDDGVLWFRMEFSHSHLIYQLVVYLVFYKDWFFFPVDQCLLTKGKFKNCKDDEDELEIEVYEGDTFVKSCGVLKTTHNTTQSGQIYTFPCTSAIGDTVLLSKTGGAIRLSEIIVTSIAQPCTGGRHLNVSDNICYPCAENSFSPGGSTEKCSPCPPMSSCLADSAASISDCLPMWLPLEVDDFLGYELLDHPLELRITEEADESDGMYGKISLTLHDRGSDITPLLEMDWKTDQITITNLCNPIFSPFFALGTNQTVMAAQMSGSLSLYFLENGETVDMKRHVISLSACKEGVEMYSSIVMTTIRGLDARRSRDCVSLDARWNHARTSPDTLPAQFGEVIEVTCDNTYFNMGDTEITCIGDNTYLYPGDGPSCGQGPYRELDLISLSSLVLNIGEAPHDPLAGCGNISLALDEDLKTCAGTQSDGQLVWMELGLDKVRYVNDVVIYTLFYDNWYDASDPCVGSFKKYKECKKSEAGVSVDVYMGENKAGGCGILEKRVGRTQADQVYKLICNVAGDSVRLSKDSGIIKVYELVVTNLECGLLHVEHGVVELQAQHNRVNVTCHGNHIFHGGEGGIAHCINGRWTPKPMCLPTCDSVSVYCPLGHACKMLHDIPLCFAGCGDMTAPLNSTLLSSNHTHVTVTCDPGFKLLGNSVVTCDQETGLWDDGAGPWCAPRPVSSQGNTVLAVSRPVLDASRLLRLKRWTFTAKCPDNYIVMSCRCYDTEDFPGNCEGAVLTDNGTSCQFTNSKSNNVHKMQGVAVCVKNSTIEAPCDYTQTLPLYRHVTSQPSHHPHITCHFTSHPTPVSCWTYINQPTDSLYHWKGRTLTTGEVDLGEDGSCSVECFAEGEGECILTMLCSAQGLASDSPLTVYKLATCPTCNDIVCRDKQFCAFYLGAPTCHDPCSEFSVPRGHVTLNETHAVVSCYDKMYYVGDSPSLQCQPQGKWSPEVTDCVYHTCSTYQCPRSKKNYCREVESTLQEVQSSQQSDNQRIPTCFTRCPRLDVPNAVVVQDNQHAEVSCIKELYRFTGADKLECLPNGTWSSEHPKCEPKFCYIVTCSEIQFCVELDGLAICRDQCPEFEVDNGQVTNVEHSATITCNSGCYMRGNSTVECGEGSAWSSEIPTCHKMCPEVADFPASNGTQTISPTHITTTCHTGYVLVGEETQSCHDNGVWGGTPSTCQLSSCSGVQCALYHKCEKMEGVAVCAAYNATDLKITITECLQEIEYEGYCDCLLVESLLGMSEEEFVTAVIQSVSNVTLLSSPHLYHISGLLVREVAPRESYLSSNQRDGLVEVVQLFSKYIASSLQQEKEKLVRQCVLLINSLIRSEQTVSGSAATETKEQNRQMWLKNNHQERNSMRSMFNSGKNSKFMKKLKNLAEDLLNNFGDSDDK